MTIFFIQLLKRPWDVDQIPNVHYLNPVSINYVLIHVIVVQMLSAT